jgi:hypothetical protein
VAAEQDPWAASLPCYASDESGPDAAQEPPRKKQRKLWHSSDAAATRSGNLQCDSPATPDLTSAQFSPDAFFSQPCAPEADPAVRAYGGTRGESVGHWIDAALADEGWWWAAKGAEWSIWGGCFEDSDGGFFALPVGAESAAR